MPENDPLAVSEDTWRELNRVLSVDEFELRTERRDTGYNGRKQAGMIGWLTLRLAGKTAPGTPRALGTLARFAEFCGTGAQTTHGFGATAVTLRSRLQHG